MVDIGSTMPFFIVFSTTSRWLSSTMTAPSVPINSIQVVEKFGYPGGRVQPPPTTNDTPLSIVTVIHCVSGTSPPTRFAHRAVVDLRIHAHRLGRLQAPQEEVEVVGGFHRRRARA